MRAIRRHHRRRVKAKNSKVIATEPYMGRENRPLEMSGLIPSWFKVMNRRARRAMEKQAVRTGVEPPRFKQNDAWDWW